MELFSVSHAFSNYLPNYRDQEYKENGLYSAESCVGERCTDDWEIM